MKIRENEKKFTQEEIRAIVDEELRKAGLNPGRELSADEMEQVSGGAYIIPSTHEEIDAKWDVIQKILDIYDRDVALLAAQELDYLPGKHGAWCGENPFVRGKDINRFRNHMHRVLNGSDEPWVPR